MKKITVMIIMAGFLLCTGAAWGFGDWHSSPGNWDNSPGNWDNSPNKFGNERIIRDNQGRASGYAVPRPDGGVNYFDFQGNRRGYQPGQ